ncbi:TetR/AcrR family transcriptional regulator [Nocardia bhagyanarayanae]|uniref:TetR family transcriptional regulator n=1 Tax=Nocardia bhagyanarayanae TaxID=1215925 RepID=A0A543EV44_9NOCA|nr:TetR/AcrR family transcriptional regulator [Nocardia bhagyanarayanae]TQM25447.1 TetR family transcriptional regulator [Nocardia bhagyanarayanae]
MPEANVSTPRNPTRGRIDKRQAILDAAFSVFAREGYAQSSVDAIAAEARVAKHTIYNHFGDKASLFRAVLVADAELSVANNLAAVDQLRDPDDDIGASLRAAGLRLAQCYCDERSTSLRRLLHAEIVQFPDLLDIVRGRAMDRVNDALADRLARLSLAGRLDIGDPAEAAEQFTALLTGPLEIRSHFGTRRVPDAELEAVSEAAVRTFLRAFGVA